MIGNIVSGGKMMECNFPDPQLLDAMMAQKVLLAPMAELMGDKAPKCSMIGVDYKNENGVDCSTYAVTMRPTDLTDEVLVEHFREGVEQKGFELSAIHEYTEGKPPRLIYVKRNFFEETLIEHGVSVPVDLQAALEYCGLHPINWEDFA